MKSENFVASDGWGKAGTQSLCVNTGRGGALSQEDP